MPATKITTAQHIEETVTISTTTQTATPPDIQGDDFAAVVPQQPVAIQPASITTSVTARPHATAANPSEALSTEDEAQNSNDAARNRTGIRGAFWCPVTAAAPAFKPSPKLQLPADKSPPSPLAMGERRRLEAAADAAKKVAKRSSSSGSVQPAAKGIIKSTRSRHSMPPPGTTASAGAPRRTSAEWGLRKRARAVDDDSEDDMPAQPRRTSTKGARSDDKDDTPAQPKGRNNPFSPSPFVDYERYHAQAQRNKRRKVATPGWSSSEAEADNELKIYIQPPAEANDKETSIGAPSPSPRPNENSRPKGHHPKVMPLEDQEIIQRRGSSQWEDPCKEHIAERDILELCKDYRRETARMSVLVEDYNEALEQMRVRMEEDRLELGKLEIGLADALEKHRVVAAQADVLAELVVKSRRRGESEDHLDGYPSTRNRNLDMID